VPFRCMEILIFRPRNFSFHGARAFLWPLSQHLFQFISHHT
jgi:hypothetical protein